MLLDEGPSFEYQDVALLLGLGQLKHFTYSCRVFRGGSRILTRFKYLQGNSDFPVLTILKI